MHAQRLSRVLLADQREILREAMKNYLQFEANLKVVGEASNSEEVLVQIQDTIGRDWYPDLRLDVCEFNLIPYYNYNNIEDFLRNKRKYFNYEMSDHRVISLSTHSVPGTEEYRFSLKYQVPKPSLNESMVYKDGKWSVSNIINNDTINEKEKTLILKKSDFPDVYLVYNPSNNKKLGVARVRTMNESKTLRKLFNEKDNIKILCKWIAEFEKWQPVIKC